MKVIYIDQSLLSRIACPSKRNAHGGDELLCLRSALLTAAAARSICCPFSGVHIEEISNDLNPKRRGDVIALFESLSLGYSFWDPKVTLSSQAEAVVKGDAPCLRPPHGVMESPLPLGKSLRAGLGTREATKGLFQSIGERWMSTGVRAVKKSVEKEEEQTHFRMLLDFLSMWAAGRLGEEEYEKFIFSEFSLLFATLCESYEQIRDPYPSAAAISFMGKKLQTVPCARLNIQLWKRYALQIAGRPPRAENTHLKVDHMARDVTAASSHFPYCSAVFHDRELLHLCRATADPSLQDVRLFSMTELAAFRDFVELAHAQAERPVSIETIHNEMRRHAVGKLALAAIPSSLEPLAERYRHPEFPDVELLPGGGLLILRSIEGPARQTVREAFLPLLERLIHTKRLAAPGTLFLFLYATTTSGPVLIQCLDVFAGILSIADSSRLSDSRLEVHFAKPDVKA